MQSYFQPEWVRECMEDDFEFETRLNKYLLGWAITHLFLPKVTPEKAEENLEKIEQFILERMEPSIFNSTVASKFPEVNSIIDMLVNWQYLQPSSNAVGPNEEEKFVEKYVKLVTAKDSTLPIYIRKQNCTILFDPQEDGSMLLETFRASLPSKLVMSSVGSLSMSFPETSQPILNPDLLSSRTFAKSLFELTRSDISISTTFIQQTEQPAWGRGNAEKFRDVAEPTLINDWIVSLLSPTSLGGDADKNHNQGKGRLRKKIRDQVTLSPNIYSSSAVPFRRSGMWMSIKVAVQLKLLKMFPNDTKTAHMLYKLLILYFLADISEYYHYEQETFQMDLAAQMMAKLGRRVHKLNKIFPQMQNIKPEENANQNQTKLQVVRTHVLKYVTDVMSKFFQVMNEGILATDPIANDQSLEIMPRTFEEYLADLDHQLPFLPNFIEMSASQGIGSTDNEELYGTDNAEIRKLLRFRRFRTLNDIVKEAKQPGRMYGTDNRSWLYDTEAFMMTQLKKETDPGDIRKLVCTYVSQAMKLYVGNPVGLSQMVLATLKAVQVLDKKATQAHPILKKFKSGINPKMYDCLILPHVDDMKLLNDVLKHFELRDANSQSEETILPRSHVTEDTFAVQFASQNKGMIELREEILRRTEENINQSLVAFHQLENECVDIETDIKSLQATNWEEVPSDECQERWRQISELRKTLNEVQSNSAPFYERPLPKEEILQNAVIFEILIPPVLSSLRDCLAILRFAVVDEPAFYVEGHHLGTEWMKYVNLIEHLPSGTTVQKESIITLRSPCKSFLESVKTKPEISGITKEMLIMDNKLKCEYHYNSPLFNKSLRNLKEQCTFEIKTTSSNEAYLPLQEYLGSSTHSQNEVYANQQACDEDLSLDEFLTFGSLRAGHRIQLRNLYRAIVSKQLSLEEEPVLALVLQTIWQVGPTLPNSQLGEEETERREAHQDFQDEGFCSAMLEILVELVQVNKASYNHPLTMMTAVVITVRMMEMNQKMFDRGYESLSVWRGIMKGWAIEIENLIQEENDSIHLEELRKTLLLVTISSALSYNFSETIKLNKVMNEQEDIVNWLHTISRLQQDNLEGGSYSPNNLSQFMQLLLSQAKNVSLRLQLEMEVLGNPYLFKSLCSFVAEKWSKSSDCKVPRSLHPVQNTQVSYLVSNGTLHTRETVDQVPSNVVQLEYIESKPGHQDRTFLITFDFVHGSFLVNGYAESQLSPYVTGSQLFRRFFKDNSKLLIQKMSASGSRTVNKFHGKYYEFMLTRGASLYYSTDEEMLIREVSDDGTATALTLIHHNKFDGILAPSLINNYTHWFDPLTNTVSLRRLPSQDSDYDLPPQYQLRKTGDGDTWQLYDEGNHCHVLSIQSEGFRMISKALNGLELKEHVHVNLDKETEVVTAHLPRYNLRFVLRENGLECMQYPGFHVTSKDHPKTLIGLQHSLHLSNKFKRAIIVPNGKVYVLRTGTNLRCRSHQITIDLTDQLSQPSYFIYEYDEVLNQLVPKKSKQACLYLALLHAVTSQPLPDPFTGLTGTEMSVRILQSAYIWSNSPYDKECTKILKEIRSLSPRRTYYGHQFLKGKHQENHDGSMEIIKWPEIGIPTMAAYDGYAIIVDKLIEDSQRLDMLHYAKQGKLNEDSNPSSDKLRLRSHFRFLGFYNSAATVEPTYFKSSQQEILNLPDRSHILQPMPPVPVALETIKSVKTNARGKKSRQLTQPPTHYYIEYLLVEDVHGRKDSLSEFLLADYPSSHGLPLTSVTDMFTREFKTSWLQLYNKAVRKDKTKEEKLSFSLILSAMSFRNMPIAQILHLHYISTHADQIDFPPSPDELPRQVSAHQKPLFGPSENDVKTAFFNSSNVGHKARKLTVENRQAISAHLAQKYWQCGSIPSTEVESLLKSVTFTKPKSIESIPDALRAFNALLTQWQLAQRFKQFVEGVESKLNQLYSTINVSEDQVEKFYRHLLEKKGIIAQINVVQVKCNPEELHLDELLDVSRLNDVLWEEAQTFFRTGSILANEKDTRSGTNQGESSSFELFSGPTANNKVQDIIQNLLEMLTGYGNQMDILRLAGICPRLDPCSLLKFLNKPAGDERTNIIRTYAGALAVLWSHMKRVNRYKYFLEKEQLAECKDEMRNRRPSNWKQEEYREWLLLELELDIMIRPVQIQVAEQMMEMPDGENGVMQMNMGEGKTSVIVPMLCSLLAAEDRLCRVTVLGPMFQMNLRILTFGIGGLLNRRVYTFPCKRDMHIDEDTVEKIQSIYNECLEMGGVVLTQPDHRLSFRLLGYDSFLKGDMGLGLKLLNAENWLRKYARDVLDESDELLNVKYQLVYTVGERLPLDGAEIRWKTCQRLLDIVQKVALDIFADIDNGTVEFDLEECKRNPHHFAPIRFLDSSIFPAFISGVADRVLNEIGISLTAEETATVKQFLTQKDIDQNELEKALKIVRDDGVMPKALLISGYLRRGILTLGLGKRSRVEYGVDTGNSFRQMAVPFRAKDVPAEKAEFGHPDLAILLTHLSYYYSGLSDHQLEETLQLLNRKQGASAIYGSWANNIPNIKSHLSTHGGLNLKDRAQKSELFGLLRKHKHVIDFWLSHKVFPRETKQFPSKLVLTSWDLCYERGQHNITGFSGTKDSSILLPLNISQQDLPCLLDTNKKVEKALLQNQNHRRLEMGISCTEILKKMKGDRLTVLIDAGALMLDCDNEQVATTWLKVEDGIEAVLYFDKGNQLVVKSRSDKEGVTTSDDVPFELTSYQGRLGKCGVFLDDQHTRGTDLKFPTGTRACVTVGGRMKRDKLLQACMRMRKLGDEHTVTFYLSHEAYDQVQKVGGDGDHLGKPTVTTKRLLEWVCGNLQSFNEDGLVHWAIAGRNYAQRLAAEDSFYFPSTCHNFQLGESEEDKLRWEAKAMILGEQCLDGEVTKLMDMYGHYSREELLQHVIPNWFAASMSKLKKANDDHPLPECVGGNITRICMKIVERCRQHAPGLKYLTGSNMEEEQERELELEMEMEVEEEMIIELRKKANAAENCLHEHVKGVVVRGDALQVKEGIMRLPDMFKDTTFWEEVQPECWGNDVFATTDFITVISDLHTKTDLFIRPVEWIVSVGNQLLVLSPYEVNELMPAFKESKVACRLHMFSLRRSDNQDSLLNDHKLMLPSGCIPIGISETSRANAALSLASANLYFRIMEEQEAFAKFLSLAPKPWSELEMEAFRNNFVTKTGFILRQHRIKNKDRVCGFSRDATGLVMKILSNRHNPLNEKAHVVQLLEEKRYATIPASGTTSGTVKHPVNPTPQPQTRLRCRLPAIPTPRPGMNYTTPSPGVYRLQVQAPTYAINRAQPLQNGAAHNLMTSPPTPTITTRPNANNVYRPQPH